MAASQISYDTIPEIHRSQVGDAVKLCLVSLPEDCPPGDDRGKVYSATNLRTGESWEARDSQHSCGGDVAAQNVMAGTSPAVTLSD